MADKMTRKFVHFLLTYLFISVARLKKTIEATRVRRKRLKKTKYGNLNIKRRLDIWKESARRRDLRKKLRVSGYSYGRTKFIIL